MITIDLSTYRIEEWHRVIVETDDKGSEKCIGCYANRDVAVSVGRGKGYYGRDGRVSPVQVLTQNGFEGFLLPVDLTVALDVREQRRHNAVAKLTLDDQYALGLIDTNPPKQ